MRLREAGIATMSGVSPQSHRVLALLRAMPQLAAVPTQDLHQLAMQAHDVSVEGGKPLPTSRQTLVVTGLVEVTQDGRRVAVAGPGQVLPSGPATALVPTRALTFREEQDLLSPGRR